MAESHISQAEEKIPTGVYVNFLSLTILLQFLHYQGFGAIWMLPTALDLFRAITTTTDPVVWR